MIMGRVGDLLGEVRTQLDRSQIAYRAYIANGKVLLYAKIIRECNYAVRDLLIGGTHLLPTEQAKNALALIHHIDVWGTIWEDAFIASHPSLMEVFTFDNAVTFPREEVASLMKFYEDNFIVKM